MKSKEYMDRGEQVLLHTYNRTPIVFDHGEGVYLYDVEGKKYLEDSAALGVSDWYAAATMILPAAMPNMLMSMVLAVGRAMGETMAVMMVMGNANLFPKLLGKSESIASVIALEMGTAVYGSPHYHALYAAGMVLVVLLMMINLGIHMVRKYLMGGNAV